MLPFTVTDDAGVFFVVLFFFFFFRNGFFSIDLISILFALMGEQLKTTRGLFVPIPRPEQRALRTGLQWPAERSSLQQGTGPEGAWPPSRAACHFGSRSSELRSWGSPFPPPWSQPFQQRSALPFRSHQWGALPLPSLQELCKHRSRTGGRGKWCHACAEHPGPAATQDALREQGMAMSTQRTGAFCERLVVSSGLSHHQSLGSRKAAWIWLVEVPGVRRRQQQWLQG